MDKFEKKQILEEFLIKWKTGRALSVIEQQLSEKHNPLDIVACKKIFEKWIKLGKSWKEIDRIR
ncbi:MAG: hypothetical protein V1870_01365 [Candidatus Aenigmatarchaeota archaeon]